MIICVVSDEVAKMAALRTTKIAVYCVAFKKVFFECVQNEQRFGGDKRDRTADLLHAMQALSQLSYTPEPKNCRVNSTDGII